LLSLHEQGAQNVHSAHEPIRVNGDPLSAQIRAHMSALDRLLARGQPGHAVLARR
jgi:hypothetical protein